jgi:hypothetical protein
MAAIRPPPTHNLPFPGRGLSPIRKNIVRPARVKARRSHDDDGDADGSNNHHRRPGSNNLDTRSSENKDDNIRGDERWLTKLRQRPVKRCLIVFFSFGWIWFGWLV